MSDDLIIKEIDEEGIIRYYLNGELHRLDGPAEEHPNGDRWWYIDGRLHREDGPALEYVQDGYSYWYYDGILLDISSQEEFERFLKLKFLF